MKKASLLLFLIFLFTNVYAQDDSPPTKQDAIAFIQKVMDECPNLHLKSYEHLTEAPKIYLTDDCRLIVEYEEYNDGSDIAMDYDKGQREHVMKQSSFYRLRKTTIRLTDVKMEDAFEGGILISPYTKDAMLYETFYKKNKEDAYTKEPVYLDNVPMTYGCFSLKELSLRDCYINEGSVFGKNNNYPGRAAKAFMFLGKACGDNRAKKEKSKF